MTHLKGTIIVPIPDLILNRKFITCATPFFLSILFALFSFFKSLFGKLKNFAAFIGSSPSPISFYILVNFTLWHGSLIR
jgi:hypothetical protein